MISPLWAPPSEVQPKFLILSNLFPKTVTIPPRWGNGSKIPSIGFPNRVYRPLKTPQTDSCYGASMISKDFVIIFFLNPEIPYWGPCGAGRASHRRGGAPDPDFDRNPGKICWKPLENHPKTTPETRNQLKTSQEHATRVLWPIRSRTARPQAPRAAIPQTCNVLERQWWYHL